MDCHRYSDAQGNHAMCCGSGGERISRHNHLRDHLHDTAVAAGLGPVREVRFLIPGEDSRPADVLLPHWIAGQDAAMDVTVVNPCQVATVMGAATTAGHALQHAYTRKMRGAADACQQQGVTFLPMVVESFGGWHEASVREVERLGAALNLEKQFIRALSNFSSPSHARRESKVIKSSSYISPPSTSC